MITIDGVDGLRALVGKDLGVSDWLTITQDRIDRFAHATDDHDWLHVDVERAKTTPFGKTIAHGLLTHALESKFNNEIYFIDNIEFSLIYGYRKIRLPSPVPVDSRVRMHSKLLEVIDVPDGVRCIFQNTFELEGAAKPACVAEFILHVVAKK